VNTHDDNLAEIEIESEPIPAIDSFRSQRAQLFSWTDWTQLADAPLSEDEVRAWAGYRQALRDLPQQSGFDPANPEWPIMPGKEETANAQE
jgi:hypothetical protein